MRGHNSPGEGDCSQQEGAETRLRIDRCYGRRRSRSGGEDWDDRCLDWHRVPKRFAGPDQRQFEFGGGRGDWSFALARRGRFAKTSRFVGTAIAGSGRAGHFRCFRARHVDPRDKRPQEQQEQGGKRAGFHPIARRRRWEGLEARLFQRSFQVIPIFASGINRGLHAFSRTICPVKVHFAKLPTYLQEREKAIHPLISRGCGTKLHYGLKIAKAGEGSRGGILSSISQHEKDIQHRPSGAHARLGQLPRLDARDFPSGAIA